MIKLIFKKNFLKNMRIIAIFQMEMYNFFLHNTVLIIILIKKY